MDLQRCRLCLKTNKLIDLFGNRDNQTDNEGDNNPPLYIKAMNFALVQICENDGLPSFICLECESKVDECYSFKLQIENIERKLRQMLSLHIKSEPFDFEIPLIKEESLDRKQSGEKRSLDKRKKRRKKKLKMIQIWTEDEKRKPIKEFIDLNLSKNMDVLVNNVKIENSFDDNENFFMHDDNSFQNLSDDYKNTKSEKIKNSENMLNLTDEKPGNQCESCGRIFKSITILKKHIMTHSVEKMMFACPTCPKKYTRSEHLMVHLRTHAGYKPCVCEICGRAFTKNQDLFRHQRIHSDEKKFPCPQCDRKFKRSADIHVHMRSHTGARPFSCKICSKSYTSRSGLVKHNRKVCKLEEITQSQ